ncbi:RtcB family protein [Flavihumibacter petaseus]|uniref:3'-phosphate/5'-hydroxy nucleic acid ligase n=1 Tax=Flavihumibacter petaseus NBRC 106054 TaxID=1220578 RepID=A0A0E9MZ47_9BACT|nr:RtcB family protein [Flavihumibacter petaseus]GAO42661.1 putative RNA-splicing ligase [Flavihumibacter petaseus NBRC 106054]
MEKKVNGEALKAIGFTEGKIIGMILTQAASVTTDAATLLGLLTKLNEYPESFLDDPEWKSVAQAMVEAANAAVDTTIPLVGNPDAFAVYGPEFIEAGATTQMTTAMKLPITIAGALMPDAHQGYGLPIGGVLATRNAVIPYGVGVDIGCRMALSITDIPVEFFRANEARFKRELIAQTKFGAGNGFKGREKIDHAVLENETFQITGLLRGLKERAAAQLGTSGGGNHFAEWGVIDFAESDAELGIEKGQYLAFLTHSGSRGLGATIAGHYTRLAKSICPLPPEAANLAWLDLDSEAGQEYWLAMNLAGDYASACHAVIHRKMLQSVGAGLLGKVENHHNFAWKEILNGEEVIVHRKGATPAGKGVMGIIPGSMTAPGFLVRGKGEAAAINSASHGAGRQMSRTQAVKKITREAMRAELKANEVTLIGAGTDEAPMAYKDIRQVMSAQTDLVDTIAMFTPKMVRMAGDGSRED